MGTKIMQKSLFGKKEAKKSKVHLPFESLAPIDTVEDETTFTALDYALSKDTITNVALTGTYGSGKSSILRSYEKRRKKTNERDKFLNISLATFSAEAEQAENVNGDDSPLSDTKSSCVKHTELQEIEKSILQQIFYKVSGRKIPFSRFKRIKNMGIKSTIGYTSLIVVCLMLFMYFFFKGQVLDFLKKIPPLKIEVFNCIILLKIEDLNYIITGMGIIISCFIIFLSVRFINKIRITRIGFREAGIELYKEDESSLLNKYLDEILYFFEVTDYNIVVIEDLDRFENSEIFIKLREINTLINNYEKIKHKVVFIYALRDEVFVDKSRTKFFEFIIPVIPVINSRNAGSMLIDRKKKDEEKPEHTALSKLDESFLADIGLYIDDMRLLQNCINEFLIYDSKINTGEDIETPLNRNKLFAIIIYKNLYPKDFSCLSFNEGFLYNLFLWKQAYIPKLTIDIEKEINEKAKAIETSKDHYQKDISELRTVYIAEIFNRSSLMITSKVSEFITEDKFRKIQHQNDITVEYHYNYLNPLVSNPLALDFKEIEKSVDQTHTYQEREDLINLKCEEERNKILKQIEKRKNDLRTISDMKFTDLFARFSKIEEDLIIHINEQFQPKPIKSNEQIDQNLIIFLLRNGYIAEDYPDYISYFYAGEITTTDYRFLRDIKDHKQVIFDRNLTKLENVISMIHGNEWEQPQILNNSLLQFLLENDILSCSQKLGTFIKAMYQNAQNGFFAQFICDEQHLEYYLRTMTVVLSDTEWYNELIPQRPIYLLYILTLLDIRILQDAGTPFTSFINKHADYFTKETISQEQGPKPNIDEQKIISNLASLKVRFIQIQQDFFSSSFQSEIITNCLYAINSDNLRTTLNQYTSTEETITDYLTRIKELENEAVEQYVFQHISETIQKVLLPLKNELSESSEVLTQLFNMEEIAIDDKEKLIAFNRNPIHSLLDISQNELWTSLIKHNKVSPTWKNVLEYFKHTDSKLDDTLIDFLNMQTNIQKLQNDESLSADERETKISLLREFVLDALLSPNLNSDSYACILKRFPIEIDAIPEQETVTDDKISALIKAGLLKLTEENYTFIKNGKKTFMNEYLVPYINDLFEASNQFEIDATDIINLLNSKLSDEEKNRLLETPFTAWQTFSLQNDAVVIATFLIQKRYSMKLSQISIFNLIDKMPVPSEKQSSALELLLLQFDNIPFEELEQIFTKWKHGFENLLARDGKRVTVNYSELNKTLCQRLQSAGYISTYKPMISRFNAFIKVNHKRG